MVLIKGLQKTTTVDYPGKLACAIFTAGCNFRCPFCHNPELIEKERYEKLKTITEKEFFDFLGSRKKWIDGVVITGGEPCLQKELPEFMRKIKEKGFLVKLDTNGSNPAMLKELIGQKLVDFIAMDIKAPLERYNDVVKVKVSVEKIKESIKMIRDGDVDYEFRMTTLPRFHKMGDMINIGELLKGSKKFVVQQFENKRDMINPDFKNEPCYTIKELEEFKNILNKVINNVEIRNI